MAFTKQSVVSYQPSLCLSEKDILGRHVDMANRWLLRVVGTNTVAEGCKEYALSACVLALMARENSLAEDGITSVRVGDISASLESAASKLKSTDWLKFAYGHLYDCGLPKGKMAFAGLAKGEAVGCDDDLNDVERAERID